MRALDLVRLTCRHALRRRWRVVPSLIGVALGVATLVVVLTAADTIHTSEGQGVLGQQSLRQITVSAASSSHGQNGITEATVNRFAHLPHVEAAYPLAEADVVGVVATEGYVVPIGNLPAPPDRPPLSAGHWPSGDEVALATSGLQDKSGALIPGTRLLGHTLVLHVSSFQGLGAETLVSLTVTGLYQSSADDTGRAHAYAQLGVVNHLLALSLGSTDAQYLATAEYPQFIIDADAPQNVPGIGRAVDAQGFVTNFVDKQLPGLTGHLRGVQLTAAVLSLVIILLCALSVGNLVASSVRQRKSELGIMLAIGFSHRVLAAVVAGEALVTGLAGALLGVGASVVGIAVFTATHSSAGVTIPVVSLPAIVALSAMVCLLAGLLPAWRVLRMDCVDAMRAE